MLELRNITKDYVSGNNVTHALKGISVNFRKNEFVSILGQSGCGKTTTLNIIGGLDRYTKGNLLINGKSTKQYKDRDWDTYRNHSIGFVFQTYNLIDHQNILKNVELALTISGVSKAERRQRAYDVLKIVGLDGMEKKRPNQLSGGQCQRVAIARALINNPDILLADEPTGALDSETSIQIMDLLKEVASERLVIMVTHNPDLANKYSTRIITMSDGLLTSDSNPFDGKEEKTHEILKNSQEKPQISKGKKKKTSMSLFTSMGLSLSNLRSKMKRTVLVTIAGSIGIIGVSAVLAVSRGVKDYIKDLQNDMLSSYPISIAEESLDLASLVTGLNSQEKKDAFVFNPDDPKIGVDSMISYLMSAYSDMTNVKTNKIDEKLMSFLQNMPRDDIGAVVNRYGIDPTNNLFAKWNGTDEYYSFNGLTQRYIAELKTVEGFTSYASFVDLFTSFMNELPEDDNYILDQYDVLTGDPYSTNVDDLVLVVDQNTTLTDIILAQIGVFDHESFLNIAKCAMEEQKLKKEEGYDKKTDAEKAEDLQKVKDKFPYSREFQYEDLFGKEVYYFPQDTIYSDYSDVADDETTVSLNFLRMDGGLKFYTLSAKEVYGQLMLTGMQLGYLGSLTSESIIVLPSIQNKSVSQLTDIEGDWFGFMAKDLSELSASIKNDGYENTLKTADFLMKIDEGNIEAKKLNFATSFDTYFDDPSSVSYSPVTNVDYKEDKTAIKGYSCNAVANSTLISNYNNPANGGIKMKISSILRLKDSKRFGSLSRGLYYSKAFRDKFVSDSSGESAHVTKAMEDHIKNKHSEEFKEAFVKFEYIDHSENKTKEGYASSLNGDLSYSFSDLFSGLTGINYASTNSIHYRSLCGYKAVDINNEDGVFQDVEFKFLPREVNIYPKSFEGKNSITDYLDHWNSDDVLTIDGVEYTRADRDELTYTDTISLIVSVIDTFINAITIALVVFTSLSLVVSCFMIAVITYISVVERIKEIGVIRSLGGRKGDVATLFIVETLMTGLFSGVFGIFITYILQIVVNLILVAKFGIAIMNLTVWTALMMIGISIGLSVLSGLIPSQSAAHKDPVVALRSNE